MMKRNKEKIEENFFTSNIFLFESYGCHCEKTYVSSNINEQPLPAIRLTCDTMHKINFAFASKKGLVRLNDDGSIAESNILGKLVAIKRDNLKEISSFFERNGFLLPIPQTKSEIIGMEELKVLIDRLQATLELISTITDMSRTSYTKIIRLIFYHLFAPVFAIEIEEGKYKRISDRHKYSIFLEKYKDAVRDKRLNDTFNKEDFEFNDNIASFNLNADWVDSVLNKTPTDPKYETTIFQNVFTAYCTPREGKQKTMLFINDFIFHYLYEVGIINYVDLNTTSYINDSVDLSKFTERLKAAALTTAKYIIKEELEFNLRYVRPTYNISKLEPAWKIDSLLSAMYFGLFYMRPNMETYRRCANPKCGEFFLVSISSQKKIYCCHECMNRMMAARNRARKKIAKSKTEK